jgi:hypothetical protein
MGAKGKCVACQEFRFRGHTISWLRSSKKPFYDQRSAAVKLVGSLQLMELTPFYSLQQTIFVRLGKGKR